MSQVDEKGLGAVCDVFVDRNQPFSSMPPYKWCGEDMDYVNGKWKCPKHGIYVEAIKTLPHGGYATLRTAGLI